MHGWIWVGRYAFLSITKIADAFRTFGAMEFQIRPAQAQDFPAIHALILALADFEKAPNEVDLTPEGLEADWNAGRFQAWVAVADGHIRGMAWGFWG
jgi:hypothetical protein